MDIIRYSNILAILSPFFYGIILFVFKMFLININKKVLNLSLIFAAFISFFIFFIDFYFISFKGFKLVNLTCGMPVPTSRSSQNTTRCKRNYLKKKTVKLVNILTSGKQEITVITQMASSAHGFQFMV